MNEPWNDRDSTIAAIRSALKRRSGKPWGVMGCPDCSPEPVSSVPTVVRFGRMEPRDLRGFSVAEASVEGGYFMIVLTKKDHLDVTIWCERDAEGNGPGAAHCYDAGERLVGIFGGRG